jgi:serine/threonine-protein kinase ATR
LARKANQINAAHDAVLRAANLEAPAAKIEQARLLWKSGYSRKAIQNLQGAITDGTFQNLNYSLATALAATSTTTSATASTSKTGAASKSPQNILLAKSQLLLAKWIDQGGQETSQTILERYKQVSKLNNASDKGHYFLGAYYNKILDSELAAPLNLRTSVFTSGEVVKLVIDNYLRSMYFGPKYLYRTVPKVFTLWLNFAQEITEAKRRQQLRKSQRTRDNSADSYLESKIKTMVKINDQVKKYMLSRLPAYIPYTSFAQVLSRIDNPHQETSKVLTDLIEKIVRQYPRESLWSLWPVSRSGVEEKKKIARDLLRKLLVRLNLLLNCRMCANRTPIE